MPTSGPTPSVRLAARSSRRPPQVCPSPAPSTRLPGSSMSETTSVDSQETPKRPRDRRLTTDPSGTTVRVPTTPVARGRGAARPGPSAIPLSSVADTHQTNGPLKICGENGRCRAMDEGVSVDTISVPTSPKLDGDSKPGARPKSRRDDPCLPIALTFRRSGLY